MDDLIEECQEKFPNEKYSRHIFTTLYYSARLDQPRTLVAALNDIQNREVRNYMLNVRFLEDDGQSFTPLALAAKCGSINFIRTIVSHYEVDLERECNIIFDGIVVYGATPLWIAAGMGHLNVVKFLVSKGAQINHNTQARSTPLRAACYQGRLEVVEYLIKHGADVNLPNIYNNTCVMIAAYRGFTRTVEVLLQNGADPNEQALCGATALHYAAECGYDEICELLIKYGACLLKNEYGVSPVLLAAERLHESTVEMFLNTPEMLTIEQQVEALELLGASFANDKDKYSASQSHKYLMQAMELRHRDPNNIVRKCKIPPVFAYDNWIETESIEDLRAIRLNHHSIHMESLTIRERILGKKHPDLPQPIVYRGAIFADQGREEKCFVLWAYAIDLKMAQKISVERDLLRFAQVFAQMLRNNKPLDYEIVVSILKRCQVEIENNRKRLESPGPKDDVSNIADDMDVNITTALYLIKIATLVIFVKDNPMKMQQAQELSAVTVKLVRGNVRRRDGQTLLHRAVNGQTPIQELYTSQICQFPCYKTVSLLIRVGASVLDEDSERNTPLHMLISTIYQPSPNYIGYIEKIVELLTNAGAHLDAVNSQGLTPIQVSNSPALSDMLFKYQSKLLSLRCIAAHSVAFYKLKYQGLVPKTLETFMHMHSTDKLED